MNTRAPGVEALADDAWLLTFGDSIDAAVNARVHALAARLRGASRPWLRELVPAYTSIGVFFDSRLIDAVHVRDWLLGEASATPGTDGDTRDIKRIIEAPVVDIPVVYGGDFGPDLDSAADELGLSPATLAQRHASGDYRVAMIGFAPGFPYLSGLDPALALPRLASPRTRVPAGSVGIGGAQTGIYPGEGPGGWRLLGRTPLRLFDPHREPPSTLAPGDRVRFREIDRDEFARLAGQS